ncbi:MAG: hypothetical protein ACHREM_02590 [Polyangiales bacterium]
MIDTKSEGSTTPPTKTSFVLSLPRDTPATEVVAKATAAGLSISEHYVHTIRSAAKVAAKKKGAAKGGKKGAKKAAPAKKAAAAPKRKGRKKGKAAKAAAPAAAPASKKGGKRGPSGDKRAFIESQPSTMSGTAIIAAAKKAGISISANYVYKIRNGSKSKGKAKAKAPAAAKATKAAATAPKQAGSSGGSPEVVLSNLVVLHGIGRVRAILNEVEHRVTRLLSGK